MGIETSYTKKPFIVGVDPGITGAIGVVDGVHIVNVIDMPTVLSGVKNRRTIDTTALAVFIGSLADSTQFAIVEDVHSRPGDGAVGAFSFGKSFGIVVGALSAFSIPIFFTPPQVWKNIMGLNQDKNKSREVASIRFPSSSHLWAKKKDHGRAESVLLAEFGKRFY